MYVRIGRYPDEDSDRERDIDIVIHPYDTWSADHTLALVALPMLKQLKETKHGVPSRIDYEDMPPHLQFIEKQYSQTYELFPENDMWEPEFDRQVQVWDWIMDEMIWAFEQIIDDNDSQFYDHSGVDENEADINVRIGQLKVDREGLDAHNKRIENGLKLFGKYYLSLWD